MTGAEVEVRLLGEVSTRRGPDMMPIPGARSRSVLAALAIRPGRSRTAHALIEDVWSDAPPRSPMNALHTLVSRLRAALPDGVLEIGPAGYRLVIDPTGVDVTLARIQERQASQLLAEGSARTAVDRAATARALWTGTPGADLPAGDLRDELVTEAQRCLVSLDSIIVRGSIEVGDFETALPLALAACEARPLDESAHHDTMRTLHGLGRTNDALGVFAGLRARLADRLGSDPSPLLTALNATLLRGDAAPALLPRRSGSTPGIPPAIGIRASPNPLLGRQADIDAIEDMMGRIRVTTVLGPGGTGKTRVAHEIGARAGRQVTLVELASLRNGDDVATTIGATLGVGESDIRYAGLSRAHAVSARARVREALAARPMLLILDNCEHVIADVADIVADLTAASPGLTVLATSRAPMAITAESVYLLPPLHVSSSGSPATELFASRARAVRPTVRLDPSEVAELCRRLDGLPLAIELAAAKVRTMTVDEISVRLAQRFALLKTGDRTSPARHRTLRAVIEWSWNLLDEPQQIALRRLCRFPAGFTLSAAEAVAQFSARDGGTLVDVGTAIDGLVGQSMLSVVESADMGLRYHMLETVREYGDEQLVASGEVDETNHRTSAWVTALCNAAEIDINGDDQLAAIRRIEVEHDNLVAALREADSAGDIAVVMTVFPALAFLWSIRGAHSEVIAWAPKIVAVDITDPALSAVPDDVLATAVLYSAIHLTFGMTPRRLARARTTMRRALGARPSMRPSSRLIFQLATGPNTAAARTLAAACVHDDPRVRLTAHMVRASLRENIGNLRGAERDAVAALDIAEKIRDAWSVSVITQNLGSILSQSGRFIAGMKYYENSVSQLRELHAYEESMQVESYLCGAMIGCGKLVEARARLTEMAGGHLALDGDGDVDTMQRNATLAMLAAMTAECSLAEGDTDGGLAEYRRAVEFAGGPDPAQSPDPGTFVIIAGAVAAHVGARRLEPVRAWIPAVTAAALHRLGVAGIPDYPQIGCVAVAVGSFLIASGDDPERGVEMLLLGIKACSRQDSPSLLWSRRLDDARSVLGEKVIRDGRAANAGTTRVAARAQLLELLGNH